MHSPRFMGAYRVPRLVQLTQLSEFAALSPTGPLFFQTLPAPVYLLTQMMSALPEDSTSAKRKFARSLRASGPCQYCTLAEMDASCLRDYSPTLGLLDLADISHAVGTELVQEGRDPPGRFQAEDISSFIAAVGAVSVRSPNPVWFLVHCFSFEEVVLTRCQRLPFRDQRGSHPSPCYRVPVWRLAAGTSTCWSRRCTH
jgi:hypothetical protein